MPDNVNVVAVDDIKAEDKAEGDVKEDAVTTMTDSRPPAARSQQGLSGTKKWPMGPHQETSGWSGPQISVL
jgi:hypothetical protein